MKPQDEVTTFVNHLEEFIIAAINNSKHSDVEDAAHLNRKREALEQYIMKLAGIKQDEEEPDTLKCPECNSEMKLRTNSRNSQKFWGCVAYPKCRGTRDENGLSKEDREEQKNKKEAVDQEGGFSFNRDKRNVVTEVSPPTQDTGWVNPFAKK